MVVVKLNSRIEVELIFLLGLCTFFWFLGSWTIVVGFLIRMHYQIRRVLRS